MTSLVSMALLSRCGTPVPAAIAGAHLNASIRTGTQCRYQPAAPGRRDRWRT